MVLKDFDIAQMRSTVIFLTNTPTTSATVNREAVITGGLNDAYSILLTTRGRLRKQSGNRNLLLGLVDINERYELICRFRSILESNLRSDVKIVIDSKVFTINSWEKIDEIKHIYRFDLNATAETATINSGLGAEEITNGGFTGNANGWTLGEGWTYGSNDVDYSNLGLGGEIELKQAGLLTEGATYRVSFDVGGSNGYIVATLGSGSHAAFDAGSGSVTFDGVWHGLAGFRIVFYPSAIFDGSITNVSVKQISA